jgi:hypothetical protein
LSLHDRRSVAEMIGELLRDASALVAVFAPLERLISGKSLTFPGVFIIIALVLVLAVAGIAIEVKRL